MLAGSAVDHREEADAFMRTVLHGGAVSYGLVPLAVSSSLKNSCFEVISKTLSTTGRHFPDQQSPKTLNRVMMAHPVSNHRVREALRSHASWEPSHSGSLE